MGRYWKGRGKKRSSSRNSNAEESIWLHYTTRKALLRYLNEYREGCVAFYNQTKWANDACDDDDDDDDDRNSECNETSSKQCEEQAAVASGATKKERIVGGIIFPTLNRDTFDKPYIKLPAELTSKQRKLIHKACVEAELFHESYTNANGNREMVVSCYADGFDTVQEIRKEASASIAIHRYKPWYYRRLPEDEPCSSSPTSVDDIQQNSSSRNGQRHCQSSVKLKAEKQALDAIYKLIDQPGDCLRDVLDDLSYKELQGASLSDIPPPYVSKEDDSNSTSWMLVDTAAKMHQCVRELRAAKPCEIAFDLESYNLNKYAQLTCLVQIASDAGKEYVIDTLADGVWDSVGLLGPMFANPAIVKIGHGIGGLDVRSLHRDFGIFVVNAFDTHEAAKLIDACPLGLASLCKHYGLKDSRVYTKLKQEYQSCDWRVRPLSGPKLQYGRYDVHYLIRLRQLLMRDMVDAGCKQGWNNASNQEHVVLSGSLSQTFSKLELELEVEEQRQASTSVSASTGNVSALDAFNMLDSGVVSQEQDDASFKSSRSRGEGDLFYTPDNSFSHFEEYDDDNEDITVDILRLQPVLMSCLTLSQERCRDIWKKKSEPFHDNERYVTLTKQSKRREVTSWTQSSIQLYEALCKWRENVAAEFECLPGFIAPLEFLVNVAWKRPVTENGLRRLLMQLPGILEYDATIRSQLLDIVLQHTIQNGETVSGSVYFYAHLNLPYGGTSRRSIVSTSGALKFLMLGTICAGVTLTAMHTKALKRR